jgi:hypothetical protein
MSMKISSDTIGNRSRGLPGCNEIPQPLRHRAPMLYQVRQGFEALWGSHDIHKLCRIEYCKWVLDLWLLRNVCRFQWPRGLWRRYAAVRLLRFWVRNQPGAWWIDCYVCCVLSGRGLCDELIICLEQSYPLWCVVVCDLESTWMRRLLSKMGAVA